MILPSILLYFPFYPVLSLVLFSHLLSLLRNALQLGRDRVHVAKQTLWVPLLLQVDQLLQLLAVPRLRALITMRICHIQLELAETACGSEG